MTFIFSLPRTNGKFTETNGRFKNCHPLRSEGFKESRFKSFPQRFPPVKPRSRQVQSPAKLNQNAGAEKKNSSRMSASSVRSYLKDIQIFLEQWKKGPLVV